MGSGSDSMSARVFFALTDGLPMRDDSEEGKTLRNCHYLEPMQFASCLKATYSIKFQTFHTKLFKYLGICTALKLKG